MQVAVTVPLVCLIAAAILALVGWLCGYAEGVPMSGDDELGYDRGFRLFTRAAKWTAPRLAVVAGIALVMAAVVSALR